MDEFDDLDGFDAWSDQLLRMIDEAYELDEGASMQERIAMSRRFRAFMVASPPDESIDALDPVAAEAAKDVLDDGIGERLASLASRTAELKAITRDVGDRAAELSRTAASLRLEKTTAAVRSVTDSIESLSQLAAGLRGFADAERVDQVNQAIDALRNAKARVESLSD